MSRVKKPRCKPYVRRPVTIPMTIRFNDNDERNLQLIPHQSLDAMTTGDATEVDWHTVTCRLNTGMTLARTLYTDAAVTILAHALDSVCDIRDRWKRVGKWGASSDEQGLIGAGLTLTDDMQISCTRRELRDAMAHVFAHAII